MKITWKIAVVSAVLAVWHGASASDLDTYLHVSPRMLVEMTDISGVSISPDGKVAAFREESASVEQNRYFSSWYVVDLDSPITPLRVADGGTPLRIGAVALNEPAQWSNDSQWIYYRALFDGEVQIWRAAVNGEQVEVVTREAANVRRFIVQAGGQALTYEVGATREDIRKAEEGEYDAGILYDGGVHAAQNLFRSIPVEGRLVSHRSVRNLAQTLLETEPKNYRSVDLDSLSVHSASDEEIEALKASSAPTGSPPDIRAAAHSRDGARMVMLSGAYPNTLVRASSSSGNLPDDVCEACEALQVEGVAWRGNEEVILTARDKTRGYAQSLYVWKPKENVLRLVVASDGLMSADRVGQGSTCAAGLRYAVCVSASASMPPQLDRIDIDSGERTILADPNKSLARIGQATTTSEFLTWTDANGQYFTGYFSAPRVRNPGERVPLFITYYVCPGYMRGGYGDEWPLLSLAGAGIASLCVNAPTFNLRDAAEDYDRALSGIEAIVDILVDQGLINRERVGMGGLSFGSEVVNWVAAKSDILSAASVANVAVSPTWYWFHAHQPGFPDQAMKRWGVGSPDDTPEQWRKLSPIFFADDIRVPFLMQMVEGEYRTGIEQYVRMNQTTPNAELWVYPNETHQKYEPRHKWFANERNLDWFRYWLQDYTDPEVSKSQQYERWSVIRSARDSSRSDLVVAGTEASP